MTEFVKKLTTNRVIVSSIFILCGVLAIIFSKSIIPVMSLIFGIALFIFGLYQLVTILEVKNSIFIGFSAVCCALSLILGMVLVVNQDFATMLVGLLAGIWALVAGLVHLSQAFMLANFKMRYIDVLIKSICELVVAILLFINTVEMVQWQVILMGIILIVYGIYTLVMYFHLLKTAKQLKEACEEQVQNATSSSDIEIVIEEDENTNE